MKIINEIKQGMLSVLNNEQMEYLDKVLTHCLYGIQITQKGDNINYSWFRKQCRNAG